MSIDERLPKEPPTINLDFIPSQAEDIAEFRRYTDEWFKKVVEFIKLQKRVKLQIAYKEPQRPIVGEMVLTLDDFSTDVTEETAYWNPGQGAGVYCYYPRFDLAADAEPTWNKLDLP